ncbi:MAG TPA: IS66 family transposase, partial [Ktedonobacteraceae bacterium]|nr:IS66 family transposase [Ktedonobacteraceae bacterium]
KEEAISSLLEQVAEGVRKGWQIEELQRMIYGRRSERFILEEPADAAAIQLSLGDDFAAVVPAELPTIPVIEPAANISIPAPAGPTSRKHKRHVAHRGKKDFPAHLPREDRYHQPTADVSGWTKTGEMVKERYDYRPGQLIVIRDICPVYQHPGNKETLAGPGPVYLLEKGIAGPGLLAHLHVQKYTYHMPYYRQLQQWERRDGVLLAAATVNDWETVCVDKYLILLYEEQKKLILKAGFLQCDETTVRVCNDVAKGKTHQGYFWVLNAPEERLVLFEYNPGRGQEVPLQLLRDFCGFLQTDAYAVYLAAFKDHPHIILLCCLVHVRRKFEHALKNDARRATHVLEVIKQLYDLERKAKELSYTVEQIYLLRQQEALPILHQLKEWFDTNEEATLKKSPISEAIRYALNIWDRLLVYTTDGRLLPDTNLVENAIRPTKIGLKNYMFQGNEQGARRAAVLYTLLETCKKNDIDPYEWLKDVYTRIPNHPINRIRELLPTAWKQQKQTATIPS